MITLELVFVVTEISGGETGPPCRRANTPSPTFVWTLPPEDRVRLILACMLWFILL